MKWEESQPFILLPAGARLDLKTRGYDEEWWESRDAADRQSVVNVYSRFAALDLWLHVTEALAVRRGVLDLRIADRDALKDELRKRPFRTWNARGGRWESCERRPAGSLVIRGKWAADPTRIQAWVEQRRPADPVVLRLLTLGRPRWRPRKWGAGDVECLRRTLLEAGGDSKILNP